MSVSARACREAWDANAGMKSALFTADWQFQSERERKREGRWRRSREVAKIRSGTYTL